MSNGKLWIHVYRIKNLKKRKTAQTHKRTLSVETHTFYRFFKYISESQYFISPWGNDVTCGKSAGSYTALLYSGPLYNMCHSHETFHLFLSNIGAHLLTNKLRFPEDTLAHRKPTFWLVDNLFCPIIWDQSYLLCHKMSFFLFLFCLQKSTRFWKLEKKLLQFSKPPPGFD